MEAGKLQELSRKEREKISRRNEILQAARKVFAGRDYASATLEDIAAEAELSKGTIYLYFGNKAELFLSTFEMGMERIESIMLESISANNDDPIAGIKDIIQQELAFCEDNFDLFRIMSSESAQIELHTEMGKCSDFHQRMAENVSQNVKILADYIQNGIDKGIFKNISSTDVALALQGILERFAINWIMKPEEGKLSDKAEIISIMLLGGIKK